MVQPNTKVRKDIVPTRVLESRKGKKVNIKISKPTNFWDKISKIRIVTDGFLEPCKHTDVQRKLINSEGIAHNVHRGRKVNEQTWFSLKAERGSHFSLRNPEVCDSYRLHIWMFSGS